MMNRLGTKVLAVLLSLLVAPAFAQQACFIQYMDGTKSKPMSKATAMLVAALPGSRKVKGIDCGEVNAQTPSSPTKPSNDAVGGEKPRSEGASAQTSPTKPATDTDGQPRQGAEGTSTQPPLGRSSPDTGGGENVRGDNANAQASPAGVARRNLEVHPMDLNRETALAALTNSMWFPRDEVFGIYSGPDINLRGLLHAMEGRDRSLANRLSRSYDCAQKLQLVTIQPTQNPASRPLGNVEISPTAKGLSAGKVVKGSFGFSGQLYVFKAEDEQVKGITGIKRLSEAGAEVEFEYIVTGPTEMGNCLFSKDIPSEVFRGTATFGRYDDGWKPEKVRVPGVKKDWVDLAIAEKAYQRSAP